MAEAWGSATANKGGGGGSDPNVLKLQDTNRIRLLDAQGPRKWRQHGIDGKILHLIFSDVDPATFRSVVDPRGPDGTGSAPCPLCMKPSYIGEDGKVQQLFPISVRYAANVWDYESNSVKILIGGKQIFAGFDAVAQAGFDPTANDFMIMRLGKEKQTSYTVVRGGDAPLPVQITPEMLHDLDKFEAPDGVDRIFEVLADVGVDYDAIPMPEFTLEDALQFVMPYTKHKGLTLEQLYAADPDFMKWLYGTKREQGQYGDAVFQAMHAVLLSEGETTPLDEIPKAPPRAAVKPPPTAPGSGQGVNLAPGTIALIPPGGGAEQAFPESAKAGLLAAGFTEPAPVQMTAQVLVAPDGTEQDASALPDAAVQALLTVGYKLQGATTYVDADEVVLDFNGTKATMTYGAAKPLIDSGAATLVEA